ncbi:MAG: hypothetical protein HQ488_04105 [Parcubacteria group bacterium]|nr:hypothetical protein [Parcubacteria group bacterium]
MPLQKTYQMADGSTVFSYKNADEYWARDERLVTLLEEVIGTLVIPVGTQNHAFEIDMGRPIGSATLLATPLVTIDEIIGSFVQRPGRRGPSRVIVVHDRVPQISTFVIVVAQRFNWIEGARRFIDGEYNLKTAYVGCVTPNEPWNTLPGTPERTASVDFWCRHAIVWTPHMPEPEITNWREVLEVHDEAQAATTQ